MNILLEFSTINYKMWHSLAKGIKENFPDSRFAAIFGVSLGREDVLNYLTSQTDIKYEFLHDHTELMEKAFKSEIDFEELKKFENSLPSKSLWRIIAADRELGSKFIHGAVLKKSYINQNSNYETILRVFSGMLQQFKKIFNEFKPDLFLPAIAMGAITVFIFEQLCKESGILYIIPSNVRVKNIFAFSSNVQLLFPQVDNTYRQLLQDDTKCDLDEAEKLYAELMDEIKNPQYFDRMNSRFNIVRFDSPLDKMKWFGLAAKSVTKEVFIWLKFIAFRESKDIRRQPNNLNVFLSNIACSLQFMYQKLRLTNHKFFTKYDPEQKYIYYPLHINPEYSTQVQGTMWLDQVYLIELLAKSIPFDWKVYVKEHPGTLIARTRPPSFYKRIKSIPNVCLIPIDTDMHTLIENAQMVAVITGTAGWEAILRGRPVITFADNTWDVLELSRKCTDVEKLSKEINNEIQRIALITFAERRRRIVYLLAAMLKHGFEITYPNQFVYTEPGTDEEYEVVGRETADALKKYLEYLNIANQK